MKLFKLNIVFVLLVAFGCDVLEQSPQTAISETIAIRDQKSAEGALNGLYNQIQSGNYYGDNIQIISDVSSDISQSIGTWDFYREMDTYVTVPGNQEIENLWAQLYSTVNHANNIIVDVPKITDTPQAVKDQILGEAYFIRALAYFDLARNFGGVPGVYGTLGVPIVTQPSRGIDESSFPSRSTLQETYNQVLADLQEASGLLSGLPSKTRASEASVKALYSRVHLYLKNYTEAASFATDVIDNFGLSLEQDYASIFADENSSGTIFEIAYNTTDDNGIRFWYFPSSLGGRGDIALHDDFANLVLSRALDERGELIGRDNNVGVYFPSKYGKAGGDDNIQVLRLAEMHLNRAEARANATVPDLVGALADLNLVRNRANLPDTVGAGVATKDQVLDAIALERSIEFMMEGHRFYDLVRTGKAMTVLTGVGRLNGPGVTLGNAGRMVFPIPSSDIDANKNLEQNDAYK